MNLLGCLFNRNRRLYVTVEFVRFYFLLLPVRNNNMCSDKSRGCTYCSLIVTHAEMPPFVDKRKHVQHRYQILHHIFCSCYFMCSRRAYLIQQLKIKIMHVVNCFLRIYYFNINTTHLSITSSKDK